MPHRGRYVAQSVGTVYLLMPADRIPSELPLRDACVDVALAADASLVRKHLAGGDYAVFQFRGSLDALEDAHAAIRWHWYPQSGARMRDAPAFHRLNDAAGEGELVAEIFFPIERGAPRSRAAANAVSPARNDAQF